MQLFAQIFDLVANICYQSACIVWEKKLNIFYKLFFYALREVFCFMFFIVLGIKMPYIIFFCEGDQWAKRP